MNKPHPLFYTLIVSSYYPSVVATTTLFLRGLLLFLFFGILS